MDNQTPPRIPTYFPPITSWRDLWRCRICLANSLIIIVLIGGVLADMQVLPRVGVAVVLAVTAILIRVFPERFPGGKIALIEIPPPADPPPPPDELPGDEYARLARKAAELDHQRRELETQRMLIEERRRQLADAADTGEGHAL